MNRPDFLTAICATAAALSTPRASIAAPSSIPLAYTGTIRMWEYDGGFPVVFAATAPDARLLATAAGFDISATGTWRLVPANEPFTMLWDDAVPAGFQPDYHCECNPETLATYGCECAYCPSLTMPAATWAENSAARGADVIGEYDG